MHSCDNPGIASFRSAGIYQPALSHASHTQRKHREHVESEPTSLLLVTSVNRCFICACLVLKRLIFW